MNEKPRLPIMAMAATTFEYNDYLYVFDHDGVLWYCQVNVNGIEWKRLPIKEDAK